ADPGEGDVGDPVAGRVEDPDLDPEPRVALLEAVLDVLRLPEREPTSPGTETNHHGAADTSSGVASCGAATGSGTAAGSPRKIILSRGGAMKVVNITMMRTALNTSEERMPLRRPMSAKIRPTS